MNQILLIQVYKFLWISVYDQSYEHPVSNSVKSMKEERSLALDSAKVLNF